MAKTTRFSAGLADLRAAMDDMATKFEVYDDIADPVAWFNPVGGAIAQLAEELQRVQKRLDALERAAMGLRRLR